MSTEKSMTHEQLDAAVHTLAKNVAALRKLAGQMNSQSMKCPACHVSVKENYEEFGWRRDIEAATNKLESVLGKIEAKCEWAASRGEEDADEMLALPVDMQGGVPVAYAESEAEAWAALTAPGAYQVVRLGNTVRVEWRGASIRGTLAKLAKPGDDGHQQRWYLRYRVEDVVASGPNGAAAG